MSRLDLKKGDRVRIRDRAEETVLGDNPVGVAPGPWHYGRILGFLRGDDGQECPLVQIEGALGTCVGFYTLDTSNARVEKVSHRFSEN